MEHLILKSINIKKYKLSNTHEFKASKESSGIDQGRIFPVYYLYIPEQFQTLYVRQN